MYYLDLTFAGAENVLNLTLGMFILHFLAGVVYAAIFGGLFAYYEKNSNNKYKIHLYVYLKSLTQKGSLKSALLIFLKDSIVAFLGIGSLNVISFLLLYRLKGFVSDDFDLYLYYLDIFYFFNFYALTLIMLFSFTKNKEINYYIFNFLFVIVLNLALGLLVSDRVDVFYKNSKVFIYIIGTIAVIQFFFPKIFTRGRNKKIVGHTTAGVPLTEQETSQEDAEKESEQWENDNN